MVDTELIQARLRLAAEGKRTYAETAQGSDRHELMAQARAFDLAVDIATDPARLKDIIPSEMWDQIE